jgi:TusA-related sulfurtransferase
MTEAAPAGLGAGEQTVDARGRRCPLPIIDLAAAARTAPIGTVIILIADDPAANADVPAWCRMRGQVYEGSEPFTLDGAEPGSGSAQSAPVAYRVRIVSA